MANWLEKTFDRSPGKVLAAVVLLVFLIAIGCWISESYFEARTYSKLTGKQVTTWDAMWVEFRVIEPAKGDDE